MQESVRSLTVLSSDADRREFNECPEGRDFFLDVLEVYRLVQRMASSASEHGILNPSLKSELSGLRELFRSHMPYITLTDIRTSWESAISEPVIPVCPIPLGSSSIPSVEASGARCGLCLVALPTEQTSVVATAIGKVVALAGRSYHMSCANFWINRTSWESAISEPVIPVCPIPLGSSSIPSVEASGARCGLCLVALPTEQTSVVATAIGKVVALAGRSYHMSCANFWINRVQLGLPALTLP
ncbi:hypothetical protein AHF37_06961 [Paragonimus kellicotti]|nr:hypothetical protein AHF37_06961 [Paragonimus kellicotti]